MDAGNPLPLGCMALLPALLGVIGFGLILARRVSRDGRFLAVVAPALSVSAWLAAVHAAARAFESFVVGLFSGTLAVAFFGALLFLLEKRRGPMGSDGDPPQQMQERTPLALLLGLAGLATALMLPAALGWAFHDEVHITGHMSIASQIQNDIYPPRNLTFSAFELRYHYGFALLAAMLTALFRLRVDAAIDLITIAGWFHAFCALVVLGDRLLLRPRGAVISVLALFGGGFPFLSACLPSLLDRAQCAPFDVAALSMVTAGGVPLSPPVASNFFQHPWSLGIPLAAAALILFDEQEARSPIARAAGMSLLLLALSIGQYVLFLSLSPVLWIAESVRRPFEPRRALAMAAAIGAAWLLAARLGGFFAPAAEAGSELHLNRTLIGSPLDLLAWDARNFGFLLPLGIAGFAFLRRHRLLYLGLFAGGFLVVDLFEYGFSWDINKFSTVAELGLAVPAGAAVSRLLDLESKLAARALAAVAIALSTASGFSFLASFAVETETAMRLVRSPPMLPEDDALAVAWVRARIATGETVHCRPATAQACAVWGGLPQLFGDSQTHGLGFSDERLLARESMLRELPGDLQPYLDANVRFVILHPSQKKMTEIVDAWIHQGRARAVAHFGAVSVIALGSG